MKQSQYCVKLIGEFLPNTVTGDFVDTHSAAYYLSMLLFKVWQADRVKKNSCEIMWKPTAGGLQVHSHIYS